MLYVFLILLLLACVALGFVVLIQNPKGGGLTGSVGGINNQFMGVQQTNKVLENGTWMFAGIIVILCIFSSLFFKGAVADDGNDLLKNIGNAPASSAPAQQQPANAAPATPAPAAPAQTTPAAPAK